MSRMVLTVAARVYLNTFGWLPTIGFENAISELQSASAEVLQYYPGATAEDLRGAATLLACIRDGMDPEDALRREIDRLADEDGARLDAQYAKEREARA